MKVTRDFTIGLYSAKKGDTLTRDNMTDLGRTRLLHLRDIAQVIEGDIPDNLPEGPGSTIGGAITADEAMAQGQLDAAFSGEATAVVSPSSATDSTMVDETGGGTGTGTRRK